MHEEQFRHIALINVSLRLGLQPEVINFCLIRTWKTLSS